MTYLVIGATVVLLAVVLDLWARARDERDAAPLPSPFLEDYRPQYVEGWRPDVIDLRTDDVSAPDAPAGRPSYSYFG